MNTFREYLAEGPRPRKNPAFGKTKEEVPSEVKEFKKKNNFTSVERGSKKACGSCGHFYKGDQECQNQDLDGAYFKVDYKWDTCDKFSI